MVETQDIREAFSVRLNKALDGVDGIRPARGRNIDLNAALERLGARATKQATHKWLSGASMPERGYIELLARWLNVRAEWLEYGHGAMREGENIGKAPVAASKARTALEMVQELLDSKAGKSLSSDAQQRLLNAARDAVKEPSAEYSNVVTGDFSRPGLVGDEILIPRYDIRASLGDGQLPADYAEAMSAIKVSAKHLADLGITYDNPAHLSVITGWGQSMAPTINDKDPMIIDLSVREFTGDGIYLFVWDDLLYVKRLQKANTSQFEMISDNPRHKDRIVDADTVYIQAKILLIWNASRA